MYHHCGERQQSCWEDQGQGRGSFGAESTQRMLQDRSRHPRHEGWQEWGLSAWARVTLRGFYKQRIGFLPMFALTCECALPPCHQSGISRGAGPAGFPQVALEIWPVFNLSLVESMREEKEQQTHWFSPMRKVPPWEAQSSTTHLSLHAAEQRRAEQLGF